LNNKAELVAIVKCIAELLWNLGLSVESVSRLYVNGMYFIRLNTSGADVCPWIIVQGDEVRSWARIITFKRNGMLYLVNDDGEVLLEVDSSKVPIYLGSNVLALAEKFGNLKRLVKAIGSSGSEVRIAPTLKERVFRSIITADDAIYALAEDNELLELSLANNELDPISRRECSDVYYYTHDDLDFVFCNDMLLIRHHEYGIKIELEKHSSKFKEVLYSLKSPTFKVVGNAFVVRDSSVNKSFVYSSVLDRIIEIDGRVEECIDGLCLISEGSTLYLKDILSGSTLPVPISENEGERFIINSISNSIVIKSKNGDYVVLVGMLEPGPLFVRFRNIRDIFPFSDSEFLVRREEKRHLILSFKYDHDEQQIEISLYALSLPERCMHILGSLFLCDKDGKVEVLDLGLLLRNKRITFEIDLELGIVRNSFTREAISIKSRHFSLNDLIKALVKVVLHSAPIMLERRKIRIDYGRILEYSITDKTTIYKLSGTFPPNAGFALLLWKKGENIQYVSIDEARRGLKVRKGNGVGGLYAELRPLKKFRDLALVIPLPIKELGSNDVEMHILGDCSNRNPEMPYEYCPSLVAFPDGSLFLVKFRDLCPEEAQDSCLRIHRESRCLKILGTHLTLSGNISIELDLENVCEKPTFIRIYSLNEARGFTVIKGFHRIEIPVHIENVMAEAPVLIQLMEPHDGAQFRRIDLPSLEILIRLGVFASLKLFYTLMERGVIF